MSCVGNNYIVPGANPCADGGGGPVFVNNIVTQAFTTHQYLNDTDTGYLQQSGIVENLNGTLIVYYPLVFDSACIPIISISPIDGQTNAFTLVTNTNDGFTATIADTRVNTFSWTAVGYMTAVPSPTSPLVLPLPNLTFNVPPNTPYLAFTFTVPRGYIWGQPISFSWTIFATATVGNTSPITLGQEIYQNDNTSFPDRSLNPPKFTNTQVQVPIGGGYYTSGITGTPFSLTTNTPNQLQLWIENPDTVSTWSIALNDIVFNFPVYY
jgi:hypothetical protein